MVNAVQLEEVINMYKYDKDHNPHTAAWSQTQDLYQPIYYF